MHINLNMLFFAILLGKLLMGREGTTYKLNLNPEATGEPHIIHSHAQLNSTRSFLVIHCQKLKILCSDTRWWTEKTSVWSERRGHPANRPQIVTTNCFKKRKPGKSTAWSVEEVQTFLCLAADEEYRLQWKLRNVPNDVELSRAAPLCRNMALYLTNYRKWLHQTLLQR